MPQLMIRRQDSATDPQPSMSVSINGERVLAYLPNHSEKAVSLAPGSHVVQLHCAGVKSKPFVVSIPESTDQEIQVGMRRQGKTPWWVYGLSGAFWVPVITNDNWWFLIPWAAVIVLFNVWLFRRRQGAFEIKNGTT